MNELLNQLRQMISEVAELIESYPGAIQDVSEQTFRIGASIQLKLLRLFGWTYDDGKLTQGWSDFELKDGKLT
jgi:hypothetical protein